MRNLLKSLLVALCCLCLTAIVPAVAFAGEAQLQAEDGEVELQISKEVITNDTDLEPGDEVQYRITAETFCEDEDPELGEPTEDTIVQDTLDSGLELVSVDSVSIKDNVVVEEENGFSVQFWTEEYEGIFAYYTTDPACEIICTARVTDAAKAGSTLTNTAVFSAKERTDVTAAADVTVAGDEEDIDDDEDIGDDDDVVVPDDDITPDDDVAPNDPDDDAPLIDKKTDSGEKDYSAPTGDRFYEFILWLFGWLI